MIDNSEHAYEDVMLFRNLNDEVMRKSMKFILIPFKPIYERSTRAIS